MEQNMRHWFAGLPTLNLIDTNIGAVRKFLCLKEPFTMSMEATPQDRGFEAPT